MKRRLEKDYDINGPAVFLCVTIIILTLVISCGKKQSDQSSANATNLASVMADKDSVTIPLVGQDSVTVFDLLKQSHQIDSWPTALGRFVNGIDSFKNSAHAFWVYSVNDTMPDIASDKRFTRAGDKVIWHFRRVE